MSSLKRTIDGLSKAAAGTDAKRAVLFGDDDDRRRKPAQENDRTRNMGDQQLYAEQQNMLAGL